MRREVDNNTTENNRTSKQEYEVGYKKPPMHTRFKKGQSGNKRGRQKVLPSTAALLKKILKEKRRMVVDGQALQMTNQEALFWSVVTQAIKKGDHQTMKAFNAII